MPARSAVMEQSWHDLLFAHWPVAPAALRPLLPPGLELDTRDGAAWVAVVPFRMTAIRLRGLPLVPGTHAFPELNVRTYVVAGGRPGVWFFSLDAANALAVSVARAWFRLPYFRARMRCEARDDGIEYESVRSHAGAPPARLRADYEPTSAPFLAERGSLEHWLTERYCLYAAAPRGLLRGEIHHAPWPLQRATARFAENGMARAAGIELPGTEPHLLFARRIDVVCWAPDPV